MIHSHSRTQATVSFSSAEEETNAIVTGADESRCVCSLVGDFGYFVRGNLHADSAAAEDIVTNLGMGMMDYFVKNDIGKKAGRKREVQMVVRNKTAFRLAHGVLISACMIGEARGEQVTIVLDVKRDFIIAILVTVIVILLTLQVSEMWRPLSRRLLGQPETPPAEDTEGQPETPPEVRRQFEPSEEEAEPPEAREFQADMLPLYKTSSGGRLHLDRGCRALESSREGNISELRICLICLARQQGAAGRAA